MVHTPVDEILRQPLSPKSETDLRSALSKIKARLGCELSACFMELTNASEVEEHGILEEIAKIQCALDIITSANTSEGLHQVYTVLKEFQTS